MAVIQHYIKHHGSKLCLSKDKVNKWLKKPERKNTTTLQRAQAAVWDYTTWSTSSSRGRPPSGSVVSSLKHKLSKHEYKDVLSKTYRGAILLMHMYQGKGRWGLTCRSASFDLA